MYKCTDCGKEYKERPPFCECGNNNFEEIGIINNTPKKELKTELNQEKSDNIPYEIQIPSEEKKDYTYIVLTCIISLCIILIIIGIFHLKNVSKKDITQTETKPVQTEVETPMQPLKNQKNEEMPNHPKNQVFTFSFGGEQQNKQEPKKEITKPKEQPKQTQKTDKKTQPAQKKTTTVEVKKQPQTVSTQKQTQSQPKTSVNQTQTQPKKPQTNTTQPQTQPQPQAQKPAGTLPADKTLTSTPKVNTPEMKKELLQYKIALRNRISSDIDFTKVIGDGKCVITFKINSSGKLINRAFAQQSDNDSLNDAVYSAVMNNPAYNPPPSGYKNETLRLTVKIYGGRFEVDLS